MFLAFLAVNFMGSSLSYMEHTLRSSDCLETPWPRKRFRVAHALQCRTCVKEHTPVKQHHGVHLLATPFGEEQEMRHCRCKRHERSADDGMLKPEIQGEQVFNPTSGVETSSSRRARWFRRWSTTPCVRFCGSALSAQKRFPLSRSESEGLLQSMLGLRLDGRKCSELLKRP